MMEIEEKSEPGFGEIYHLPDSYQTVARQAGKPFRRELTGLNKINYPSRLRGCSLSFVQLRGSPKTKNPAFTRKQDSFLPRL
jgi:hypothetical protein